MRHLFSSCYFNADIHTHYNSLKFNGLKLEGYSVEMDLNWNRIQPIIGFNRMTFQENADNPQVNLFGSTLGVGTWIGRPFHLSAKMKVSIYEELVEYHAELYREFGDWLTFIRYYQVENFNELTIGLGYRFTYLFKSQKPGQ